MMPMKVSVHVPVFRFEPHMRLASSLKVLAARSFDIHILPLQSFIGLQCLIQVIQVNKF